MTDEDIDETGEWLSALEGVVRTAGVDRGMFLLRQLESHAQHLGVVARAMPFSATGNTPSAPSPVKPSDSDTATDRATSPLTSPSPSDTSVTDNPASTPVLVMSATKMPQLLPSRASRPCSGNAWANANCHAIIRQGPDTIPTGSLASA